MRTHSCECAITVMGTEIPVAVEYVITSHGSGGSYFDPPEPPEFYIDAVTDSRGNDIFEWCNTNRDWENKNYKPWLSPVLHPTTGWQDPIRVYMFSPHRATWAANTITKLQWNSYTYIDTISDYIMEHEIGEAISNDAEDSWSHYYENR